MCQTAANSLHLKKRKKVEGRKFRFCFSRGLHADAPRNIFLLSVVMHFHKQLILWVDHSELL